jgi:hypothetical protein
MNLTGLVLATVLSIAVPPLPESRILDRAELLSDNQRKELAGVLQGDHRIFAVVTLHDCEGETPEAVAKQLRVAWGLAGVLLVVQEPHRIWLTGVSSEAAERVAARMSVGMRDAPGERIVVGAELFKGELKAKEGTDMLVILFLILLALFVLWVIWNAGKSSGGTWTTYSGGSSGGFSCGGGGGGDSGSSSGGDGGGGSW